ncbi:hypothetical protein [Methylobacterium sp. SI9]|uniref:hypothetical protein n=1 Tax=Methylobacterium guangdongense TaxID=3138811 RepID=UPI00313EC1AE
MGKVLSFGRRAPVGRPKPLRAPWGSDVFLIQYGTPPHAGWTVFDESPSGGSAGSHGDFTDRAEAVRAGRQLAEEIGGIFHDGGAA